MSETTLRLGLASVHRPQSSEERTKSLLTPAEMFRLCPAVCVKEKVQLIPNLYGHLQKSNTV